MAISKKFSHSLSYLTLRQDFQNCTKCAALCSSLVVVVAVVVVVLSMSLDYGAFYQAGKSRFSGPDMHAVPDLIKKALQTDFLLFNHGKIC